MLAPFALKPKGTVRARMVPIARELQERGHEVEIIVPPWDNLKYSGRSISYNGVPVTHIKIERDTIGGNLAATYRLIRVARSRDADIYHAFKPKGHSGLAALYLSKRSSTPVVLDTDDWEGYGGQNRRCQRPEIEKLAFHYQERLTPRYVDATTVASRTLQTQVWGERVPPEQVFYVPNGQYQGRIDLDSTNPDRVRETLGIGDVPIVLLYTRFFEYDLRRVVEIFSGISDAVDDVAFVTIGTGKHGEHEEFADLIQEAGLDEQTHMLGWVEFEELPDYFTAATVGLFPFDDNLISRSKCPAKLTELMLAEVPVVADAVGQIREYIMHGESGLLCPPESTDAFVTNTVELLEDSSKREGIGEAARQRILTQFNWQQITNSVEEAYTLARG